MNGHRHANAAGVGGACAVIIIAVLTQGVGVKVDATVGAAIGSLTAYLAAWLPKPPHPK